MTTPTCPNCGGHRFSMLVKQFATIDFTYGGGEHEVIDEPGGDIEFDASAWADCTNCGHGAPLGEMLGEAASAIETLRQYGGQIGLLYGEHEELREAIATAMPDFVYDEWFELTVADLVRHILETDDEENI